jgi:methylmalonyl-CoA/ethylmalonyl-CoA epimerase
LNETVLGDASTENFGLTRIGQIAVPVEDVERAIAFYRDVLGMRFLFSAPPGLAFFDCGGIRLMLDAAAGDQERCFSSIIYYRVPDIGLAFDALRDRGARFEGEPHLIATLPDHELWMAFLHDPDRNLLALMSEVSTG